MSFPVLLTGASNPRRVPLHPDDAARYEQDHSDALSAQQAAFDREMQRLDAFAAAKNEYDTLQRRRLGPVDQEYSMRKAGEVMADLGMKPEWGVGTDLRAWATSQPTTRAPLFHVMALPENLAYQAADALSGQKPIGEIAKRLALAAPGSLYPPAGYAVEPGRQGLYERSPVAGMAADFLMPDPTLVGRAAKPAVRLMQAADDAWKTAGRAQLIDDAGNVIRQLRVSD